jgi:hypothetical protein
MLDVSRDSHQDLTSVGRASVPEPEPIPIRRGAPDDDTLVVVGRHGEPIPIDESEIEVWLSPGSFG